MLPKHGQFRVLADEDDRKTTATVGGVFPNLLKTSLYDWDSPSSFTGTVKRRPHSIATTNCSSSSSSSSLSLSSSSPGSPPSCNNNSSPYKRKSFHSGQQQIKPRASSIIIISSEDDKKKSNQKLQKVFPNKKMSSSMKKDKPTKLRIPKVSDRNANATGNINTPPISGNGAGSGGGGGGGTLKKHHEAKSSKLLQLKSPSGNKVPNSASSTTIITARNQSSKKSTTSTSTLKNAPLPPLPPPPTFELPPFMGPGSGAGGGGGGGGNYRFTQNPYDPVEFTELFCDFPVCYESTTIIAANNFAGIKPLPPPYREPPPPTPPPISQMPSLLQNHGSGSVGKRQQQDEIMAQTQTTKSSNSNTSSPSRGKVVLSKKERKELTKNNNKSAKRTRDDPAETDSCEATALQKHNNYHRISSSSIITNNYSVAVADEEDDRIHINAASVVAAAAAVGTEAIVVSETSSPCKQKSPYKGRVTELKNCIAKINSRGLFSSLSSSSSKKESNCSSGTSSINGSVTNLSNNIITMPTSSSSPIRTIDLSLAASEGSDSTSPFKNIPVRQRKGGIPPMENYCLFDPSVDFINEKTLKRRKMSSDDEVVVAASPNLIDDGDEFIEEIIYDDKNPFEHHNYFVIDPDDFEVDPSRIGIPNPFSNEELVSQKLILAASKSSISLEKCNDDSCSITHDILSTSKDDPSSHSTPLIQSTSSSSTSKTDDDSSANNSRCCPTTTTNNDDDNNNNNNNDSTNDSSIINNDMMIGSSTSTHTAASSTSTGSSSSSSSSSATTKKLSFLNLSPFRSSSLRSNRSADGGTGGGSGGTSGVALGGRDSGSNTGGGGTAITSGRSSDDVQFRHRTIPIESNYVLFNPGPVPSRNVQYKIRKPRPLSTHSDADSGFLSPCSPDELKFNPAILVLQQCDSVQGYIEIYTDWANYYLDRAKSKKKVTDLSADCRDGLLLADVIEAVTSFKVPDLCKKPKNQQQMYDNVNSCLNVLRTQAVSGLESITTNDICAGRLKAVLALFFALSRFKQQSKQSKSLTGSIKAEIHHQPQLPPQQQIQQQQQQQPSATGVVANNQNQSSTTTTNNANVIPAQQQTQNGNDAMINRQIPNAYGKGNGGTAIPLPATVLVQRRCPPDKVRPLPPTPNHTPTIPGLAKTGVDINGSSRPGSPPTSNHTIQTIKGAGNNNGLRQPQCKIPTSPHGPPPNLPNGSIPQHNTANGPAATTTATKHSMLDKLKLFNKDKTPSSNSSSNKSQVSKRTSSSSGFSSARSERSDSSLSLNDGHLSQIKPPAVSVTAARNKDKSKQSKLLSGSQKSSITSSSKLKLDKKEKSPARSNTDNDSKLGHSSIGRGQKSLTRGDQKVTSKSSSKTSLNSKLNDSRSESKTSLIMAPNKAILTTPGVSTSIPKPVAAIKGTSKTIPPPPVQADNKKPAALPSTNSSSGSHDKSLKREKSDISSNRTSSAISENNSSPQKTHIVKPIALLPDQMMMSPGSPLGRNLTYQQQQHIQQLQLQHQQQQQQLQNNNNISVNGIQQQQQQQQQQQFVGSPHHHHQQDPNNMTYMMTSPSLNSSRIMPTSKNSSSLVSRKMDFRSPEQNHSSKFNTVPSKIVGTIYEEEKPVSVMPMRPLLRGYNTHHVTLPTRGARGHHFVADFCESDIGQGYCSDGDALRTRVGPPSRFSDIDNGYLSEGGGGIHGGKHFLTMMRARTQLPTTIEERIRNSRGSLDSIGTTAPSSNSSNGSKMDSNGSPNRSSSRNGRDNWSKMPDPPVNGHNNVGLPQQHHHQHQQQQQLSQPPSPTSGRKDKSSPRRSTSASKQHQQQQHHGQSSSSSSSGSSRTKGVPPSFGYVKRSNGSATSTAEQQNIMMMGGGGGNSCGQQQQQQQQAGRTAHVSAVPRSGKIKVSGGTQTCNNDMQTKISPNAQHRSFSLTGPGATQLSQSIRERLATGSHSLPKPGSDMHVFQHRISNRTSGKMIDGSLSDTQTYAEVKPEYSTYAMWLKHSNTAGSRLSEGDSLESLQIGSPNLSRHQNHKIIHRGGGESPYIQSPRLNRSNSIRSTKSEKMYPSMLSRGPDVEIEPYYCLPVGTVPPGANGHVTGAGVATGVGGNVSQVVGVGPAVWSQPTSPTPINRGFGGPLSPTHGGPANLPGCHRLTYPKKNDDVHGSAASLLSGGSSLYGSAEERQANEIRRLKRELTDARDQVMSLSSQLSTNAHVVAAFEQSLSNMTQRLHQLTATAERKDGELTDMRQTIELLRKQSIQAGLTTAHMQSMGVQTAANQMCPNGGGSGDALFANSKPSAALPNLHPRPQSASNGSNSGIPGSMQRHHSSDSMCSLNSISSGCSAHDKKNKKKGWLRSSFTKAFSRNAKISKTNRHIGHGSGNADQQSTGSNQSHHHHHHGHGHHQQHSSNNGSVSHDPASSSSLAKPPSSPTKNSPQKTVTLIENAKPIDAIDHEDHQVVEELKKQLREKDLVLTDIRLEALSSASQLENLKDTVMKMRAEMISLKQNNERLQKLVTSRSLAGSEASLGNAISPSGSIGESRRYSLADGNSRPPMELPKRLEEEVEEENIPPAPAPEPPPPPLSPTTHIDLTPPPPAIEPIPSPAHLPTGVEDVPDITDGKKLAISCYLGQPESFPKYYEEILETDDFYRKGENGECSENGFEERKSFPSATLNEFVIAYTYISGKTTWQNLDYIVRKTFKDYVSRIDPGTNLGLNTDSITSYHLGEAKRGPEMGFPELLPCGYIVGNVRSLYICLQGVGSLAFDSLIPRSIVHRYISLLTEHRRLILCGPSGTGKSYLARRLAEFLVARSARGNPSEAIATFNVDHKSSKELRQYLGHIAEQASIANGAADLPSVIILDNLHHASALGDVFSCLLSAGPAAKLPCIIGTMSQATCNTTNLQLHHNFRWVLTANHMEPVKGFLGRFLRRRLFQLELQTLNHQPELASVLAWLPTVWQHINRFLEIHSSSDVTIGPRLFLSCPLDLKDSQVWFTDIWNYHLSPYLVEAVREGVQLYGRRGGAWNDPSAFIRNSYPWPYGPDSVPPLRQINAEDVGLEGMPVSNGDAQDPLLNMLMRLQEAANYSENQEQESDCASLDSNITPDSSAGAE